MKIAIVFCMLAALLLAGCGKQTGNQEYPAEVRENFLTSCQATGGSASGCACAVDKLEEKMDLEEFKKAEIRYTVNGELGPEFINAMAECR